MRRLVELESERSNLRVYVGREERACPCAVTAALINDYFYNTLGLTYKDYSVNTKGPAIKETQEFIITYILNFYVFCFVRGTFQDIFHIHFMEFTPIIHTCLHFSPTIRLLDFTRQLVKQASFRHLCPKHRKRHLKGIKHDYCRYYCHEMCTSKRIKHDIW